jgi:cell division protein FtsZ
MSKQKKIIKTKKKREVEEEPIREIKIRVVGVGGGGGLIVSSISSSLKKVLFAALNTDSRAVNEVAKEKKIKGVAFGSQITGGLGTGMNPELGKKAAEEDLEEVRTVFKDQDIIIFVSSLGGGTGSGALPVFASCAKEEGAMVYGVFTLPFSFEGDKKMNIAKKAVKETTPFLDAITILPNEKIFELVDKNTPLKEALAVMNKNLAESLEGLVETIYETGLINIDFADVRTVLENKKGPRKMTYLNTIEANLDDGAKEIVKRVVSNPLYPYTINNVKGMLFNVTGGTDIGLTDISSISENIYEYTGGDAKVILGIKQKNKYKDRVKVSVLATGCETDFFKEELTEEKEEKVEEKEEKPKKETKKTKKKPKKQVKKKKPKKQEKQEKEEEKELPKKDDGITVMSKEDVVYQPEEKTEESEDDHEKEILEQEKKWEIPSFLRRSK